MSIAQKARLPMRIIALPLTSAVRNPKYVSEGPLPLVYYHFQTPPPSPERKQGWTDWATTKASQTWANFGKASEAHWKYKVFSYGERLIDRIDFEELALKGIDPSLGPRISELRPTRKGEKEESERGVVIPLLHPKFLVPPPLAHLRMMLEKRTPRHRKGFWMWLFAAPLTAPFMLIPIIPNFPFFFCVWRSWSHYRAFKASEYLQALLHRGAIVPQTDVKLDEIYVAHAPPLPTEGEMPRTESLAQGTDSQPEDEDPSNGRVLLARDAVPPILSLFTLPSIAASDIYRAIEQANVRLKQQSNR